MKTISLATVLILLAGVLAVAPTLNAQEEPSLAPEPDFPEPEMEAEPEPPEARPFRPAVLDGEPLRSTLDFDRWVEMSYRERQTFTEGAVMTLSVMAQWLRGHLAVDGRVPPKNLNAVVRFVHDHHPKYPPGDYMQEMDRIYLTAEGQNLSIMECFQLAFRRLNSR